jgi:transcriptional regulator with XRE-family HTH domain
MRTAIQIADAMAEQHISKKELADKMGRQPSEITKWLAGDQNFTSDTLAELSYYLHAKITGESPSVSYSYLNITYDPSLVLDLPLVNINEPISKRRRWNTAQEDTVGVISNNY